MASPRVMPNRDKGWYDRIGEKLTIRYRGGVPLLTVSKGKQHDEEGASPSSLRRNENMTGRGHTPPHHVEMGREHNGEGLPPLPVV